MYQRNAETNVGVLGWAVAGATALTFDLLAEQTMSQWYRERVHDPKTRAVAVGMIALTAYHLTRPDKYPYQQLDPITRLGTAIRGIV